MCFIDADFCKCDRYKHVQSANIGVKCVTFVSETFTRYGSNITNVWQEIVMPMTLAFSHEVVHEKLSKSVNICKNYSKKSVVPFYGHGVVKYLDVWSLSEARGTSGTNSCGGR